MKGRRGLIAAVLIAALAIAGLGGCVGLAERAGRALDGSAFVEKTDALYREEPDTGLVVRQGRRKDGTGFLMISPMPNLRLYGDAPGADGGFTLRSLDFFVSNPSGWNEFSRELSGSGTFRAAGGDGVLHLDESPEALDISAGKIRRQETRLTGTQALTALRNREERIRSLTEWMREREPGREFPGQREFEAHWRPVLFPELTPAKKRPPGWKAAMAEAARGDEARGDGARTVGEDVRWNRIYTRGLLPEELWPVRDSGTLLRDWEEAAGWIYFQFEWDRIMESLAGEIRLTKVK
ncbi:MAG: hypothetical protein LBQ38_11400 [Spirochaetaceae bacterium]|jgi:hypothetical protein|nr:hypothetical protein [Spirochaetaceae bacterium]